MMYGRNIKNHTMIEIKTAVVDILPMLVIKNAKEIVANPNDHKYNSVTKNSDRSIWFGSAYKIHGDKCVACR